MTKRDKPAPNPSAEAVARARDHVGEAFKGFIGNEDAVYSIKRSLTVALASATLDGMPTPTLARTYLLSGPPSVGKTELAKRITTVLGVPFVRLDGRAAKSRDRLFSMIDDALIARRMGTTRSGEQSGMPVIEYPAFSCFVDEIHLVGEKTQEAFLTMLEADDRTVILDGEAGRRVAVVHKATWIFATTRPADLARAFRSRCTEIVLRRYTAEEVTTMIRARYPQLPIATAETIATCSRLVPRQAFALAEDVLEEVLMSDDGDIRKCVKRVMNGQGILYANGVTRDDLRYLQVLKRERRPMGEGAMLTSLYDLDATHVREDLEPYLLLLGYVVITTKGRQITSRGLDFLSQAAEVSN